MAVSKKEKQEAECEEILEMVAEGKLEIAMKKTMQSQSKWLGKFIDMCNKADEDETSDSFKALHKTAKYLKRIIDLEVDDTVGGEMVYIIQLSVSHAITEFRNQYLRILHDGEDKNKQEELLG